MKKSDIIWILGGCLLVFVFVSLFLFFNLVKYKKLNGESEKNNVVLNEKINSVSSDIEEEEFVFPDKDEMRLKYNYINRDDYPYYFSEDDEWSLDSSSYGEVKFKSLFLLFEPENKLNYDDNFIPSMSRHLVFVENSWKPVYIDEFEGYGIDNIELKDINKDNEEELIVYYNAGNRVRGLQIYKINWETCGLNDDKKCIENFSKMENLKLASGTDVKMDDEGYFYTKFREISGVNEEKGWKTTKEKYKIKNNAFELISSENNIIADE